MTITYFVCLHVSTYVCVSVRGHFRWNRNFNSRTKEYFQKRTEYVSKENTTDTNRNTSSSQKNFVQNNIL